jgi:hypothetical protein
LEAEIVVRVVMLNLDDHHAVVVSAAGEPARPAASAEVVPFVDALDVSGGGDAIEWGGCVVSKGGQRCFLSVRGVDGVNTVRCFPRSFRTLFEHIRLRETLAELLKRTEN